MKILLHSDCGSKCFWKEVENTVKEFKLIPNLARPKAKVSKLWIGLISFSGISQEEEEQGGG